MKSMVRTAGTQVLEKLQKLWLRNRGQGRFFLAISGGVDSMVLLEGIARICTSPNDRARVIVVHVNHALRGLESDKDEYLVFVRARELGFEVKTFRLDWSNETPSQNLCRQKRERIFRSLCTEVSDRVVLAHHLDDQAETVLMRLIRGTGAQGLKGIAPATNLKLRPFLDLEKRVLIAAAEEWAVNWREDSSNLKSDAYERNWVRSILIPKIEERRQGFARKLAALAEEARSWKFEQEAPLDLFSPSQGVIFARVPEGASSGLLSKTFGLSRKHSKSLKELLQKNSGGLHANRVRFTWSGGVLMAETGTGFSARGSLGVWNVPKGSDSMLRGDKVKKEFQALRVPVFFRSEIPVVKVKGRAVALLPKRMEREKFSNLYAPSPLADWWLKGPSQSSDDPAGAISR